MKTLVEKFLFQIQDAIKIGENAALKKKDKKIANVLIISDADSMKTQRVFR